MYVRKTKIFFFLNFKTKNLKLTEIDIHLFRIKKYLKLSSLFYLI